jgi:Fur family ferric uptake transcriptional regulator
MAEELHAKVTARLRRAGQRYTAGRRAVVDAIVAAERPLTAAELSGANPDLPQSTTYRNLAGLEQAGVLHRVAGSDQFTRYELSEDLGGHHHHLICVDCGTVEDFTVPTRLERSLADVMGKVRAGSGFQAATHRLDLLGTCGDCSA